MRALLGLPWLLAALAAPVQAQTGAPESLPASGTEAASTSPAPLRSIVKQRLPDGRVILTDRPVGEARTLRTWQYQPEDPQLAASRRAAAEREAAAVTERIARQLEQQREIEREIALARARAAAAEAERDAAQARSEAAEPQVVIWPRRAFHPHPPFRPHPPGAHPPFKTHPPGAHPPFKARPPAVRPPQRPGPKLPPRAGATPPPGPNKHYPDWPY